MHMNKLLSIFFLLIVCCTVKAQHAGYVGVKDITAFKNQLATASHQINSIKADFEQEKKTCQCCRIR